MPASARSVVVTSLSLTNPVCLGEHQSDHTGTLLRCSQLPKTRSAQANTLATLVWARLGGDDPSVQVLPAPNAVV